MTRLFCAALIAFVANYSYSQHTSEQRLPDKRLIVQLAQESTPAYSQQLCEKIAFIIGECTLISQQDSRWLLKIPSGFSQEKVDVIIKQINGLDGVSFAEEDRMMKPLIKPPKPISP